MDIIDINSLPLEPVRSSGSKLHRPHVRLSHSTMNIYHSCERRYLIDKLLQEQEWDNTNPNTGFGTTFGLAAAYAIRLMTEGASKQKALKYSIAYAAIHYGYYEAGVKTFANLISGLEAFIESWDIENWELYYLADGTPGIELSFKVTLDEQLNDYYCGYIDLVIRHRETRQVFAVELKTTGSKDANLVPYYRNSGQAVGYSAVLNYAEPQEGTYGKLYIVLQCLSPSKVKIHYMPFTGSPKEVVDWAITLSFDYQTICQYLDIKFFPKRSACMEYRRRCQYFGVCDLKEYEPISFPNNKREDNWHIQVGIDDLIASLLEARSERAASPLPPK